jgi:flagellar biosynthesis/type III secretory pathway protein FliH
VNALIKAGTSARAVQPFASRPAISNALAAAPAPSPPEPPLEDSRLALLRQENAELKRTMAALREAAPLAEARAREEGAREALARVQRDEEKRVKLLADGVAAGLAAWEDRLASLEALAAVLAQSSLSKLFDESGDYSDFVLGMIGRQMRALRRQAVLAVRVSPSDFADEAALARVAAQTGMGTAAIVADAELPTGECRLDLQLGHVDLGMRAQWGLLSDLLLQIVDEEPCS